MSGSFFVLLSSHSSVLCIFALYTLNFLVMLRSLRDWTHQIIASLLCIVALLLTMPRETSFNYTYSLNEPWRYSPLIASFEFPIYKSERQLKTERDSALRAFQPYFQIRRAVSQQQIKNFKADYAQGQFQGVPHQYVVQAIKMLEEVYEAGVIEADILVQLSEQERAGIRILEGTNAMAKTLPTIFSPRTAYEYMMSSDARFPREVMSRLNLHQYLLPNLIYDSLKTTEGEKEALNDVSLATGMVVVGERIIDRGERVSPRQLSILDSLQQESLRRKADSRALTLILYGQAGMVVILILSLLLFLHLFRRDLFQQPRVVYLVLSLVAVMPMLSSFMLTLKLFSIYIIPFIIVPVVLRVFIDTRTAFVSHVVMVLLVSIPLHDPYFFVVLQILSGLLTIYTTKQLTERSQIIRMAFVVTLFSAFVGFCFNLAQGAALSDIDSDWYIHIAISGLALLFAYPLLYLLERLFGFTSIVTLIELSNSNNPLIRLMAQKAQGTFVHSMQVGNLAAEVADKLNARVQLVRTGALYHDIGKMLNPHYFTENQGGINPHDQLTEEESAQIIIAHVTEGLKLAERHNIPQLVRDFIDTHHGRQVVKYFYIQACNRLGEENVDKEKFTYPGRNPQTLEQGILMMADAIEASSRSLTEYTDESLTELVHRIVDGQMASGAFDECPITLRQITEAKSTFVKSLKVMYHTRISYPELRTASLAEDTTVSSYSPWKLSPKG